MLLIPISSVGAYPGFLTSEKSKRWGGVGGWGRSLTPHTPHTPLPLKPTLCVRNPGYISMHLQPIHCTSLSFW
ncbi:MAG: hypothetical protein V7K71_32825 [Nostoc sp.]|uniref:hypothetical protein n=1 Tax=Nostoc sp. TaxID=1180 RepID=UPI002FFAB9C0